MKINGRWYFAKLVRIIDTPEFCTGEEEAEAQEQGKCAHSDQAGGFNIFMSTPVGADWCWQVKADSFFNFFEPPTIPDDPTAEVDEDTQVWSFSLSVFENIWTIKLSP